MKIHKYFKVQSTQLLALALVIAWFISGCSGSSESIGGNTQSSTGSTASDTNNSDDVDTPNDNSDAAEVNPNDEMTGIETDETVIDNPTVADPLIQNTVWVNFDIVVPAYQSSELRVELTWGGTTFTATWIGDEYWSANSELPTDTEGVLTVTFSDFNGDIELARTNQEFRTGSNATESLQITLDQFDSSQFDLDDDGVSNLDELIAGTDPTVDEDSLLDIVDYYALSDISTSRMSVSQTFESRISAERPFSDTYEIPEDPSWALFPERVTEHWPTITR